ncbi:MAG TPA: ABC transporter permease [Anaerolineaceae bacterium]|nr:ABC transporter permease [Anaerolineaceae bacterium]
MTLAFIVSILAVTIQAGASLLYATLGEILTERSGILNLGLEGMMLMGAATAFIVAQNTGNVWAGFAAALVTGALMAFIHAFLTISLRANQVVSGLALTMFGTGLANFIGRDYIGQIGPRFTRFPLPFFSKIPILGDAFFNQDILVYVVYLLVPLLSIYIYHTRPGLHLRSIGENPATADALGVNVARLRYVYTLVGGMLVGLGGAHLSLAYTPGWTEGMTAGRGWIAIALVIFATWSPARAVIGAILFGGINAIQFRMQAAGTNIPASFLNMLPYVATIVVLVVITWWETFSKRVGSPAALGNPYVREEK